VQHNRGREITDYILSVTQGAKLGALASALADVLEGFVRMYRHHAAREDTVVFPAWKEAISEDQYREVSERFEEIEHQQFGADGFDDAVKQIGEIEGGLGLGNLAQFTPPAPPSK
jgi:hemerythrin-like domain-containing protein